MRPRKRARACECGNPLSPSSRAHATDNPLEKPPPGRYMHVSLRTKGTPTHPAMATACLGIFDGGGESILGA